MVTCRGTGRKASELPHRENLDAPGRIRTSDQQLRRRLLYPPELRAQERLTQFCDSERLPYVRQTSSCRPSRSTARSGTPPPSIGDAPCQGVRKHAARERRRVP